MSSIWFNDDQVSHMKHEARKAEQAANSVASDCSSDRKCITVPILDEWYRPDQRLPFSDEVVMAFAEVNGTVAVVQVVFYGNDFSHEFRLGDTAVHVTHWLYVGASIQADKIDQ